MNCLTFTADKTGMTKNRRKYNYKILFLSYGIVVEDRSATPPVSATATLSTPFKRKSCFAFASHHWESTLLEIRVSTIELESMLWGSRASLYLLKSFNGYREARRDRKVAIFLSALSGIGGALFPDKNPYHEFFSSSEAAVGGVPAVGISILAQ